MSSEFDQENLVSIFVVEALDGMRVLTKALHPADDSLPTPQQIHEQFIIAHRIRGAAALYGYDGVARLCERLEVTFEQATTIPDAEWSRAVGAMRETVEGILTLVKAIGIGRSEDRAMVERCLASSEGLLPDEPHLPVSEPGMQEASVPAASASQKYVAPRIDAEVLSYFVPEIEEYLAAIDRLIPMLRAKADDADAIHHLFRIVHTLKGLAYTVGFEVIGDIGHPMEECMVGVMERRIPVTPELLDVFAQAAGLIRLILQRDPLVVERLQTEVPAIIGLLTELREGQAIVLPAGIESVPGLPQEEPAVSITAAPVVDGETPWEQIEISGSDGLTADAMLVVPARAGWTEPVPGIELPAPGIDIKGSDDPAGMERVLAVETEPASGGELSGPMFEVAGSDGSTEDATLVVPARAGWTEPATERSTPVVSAPSVSREYVAPNIDAEILTYFVPEIEEYLAVIDGLIPMLRAKADDADAIHRLFRAAHTLKGSAYTVGFEVIGDIGHPMEECMVGVMERRIPVTPELLDVFTQAAGLIRLILQWDPLAVERLQTEVPAIIGLLTELREGQAIVLPAGIESVPGLPQEEPAVSITAAPVAETAVEAQQPAHLSDDYFLPQLDPEVLEYFAPEAQEYLEALETDLLRLDKDVQNRELINQLFRTAHTLKGSAYTVGFQAIGDLLHHVEDFMGAVRDNRLSVLPGHTDLILRAVDVVRVLMRRDSRVVHAVRQRFEAALWELKELDQTHGAVETAMDEAIGAPIDQRKQQPELVEDQGKADKQAEDKPGDEREVIRVSYARLEKLMNLVGELVIGRGRLDQRLHALERLSDQVLACKTRLVDSIQTFADKHTFTYQSAPTSPSAPLPQGGRGFGDFGSLELDKYDDFNILARRIGEVSADIAESMAQLNRSIHRAHDDMSQLQQLTRNMRDEIGRARMVPIGTPFTRFRRAVREISRASNKDVSLVTSGEHTEVDTAVVERLVDPLIHLVRNAVYHGIEQPADRIAKGKPAAGTIYLHAAHRGNSIIIEVEDDGAGLDLEKIRAKAVKVGLAQPDQVQAMSDTDVLQYIFSAGFSTADTVGDQAGRGVGLDVVKQTVEGMNGHIEVESLPGVGTKFTLNLPLTLLITTALLVRAGTEQYAIALSSIREITLSAESALVRKENRTLLHIGEEIIEVQSLRYILRRELSPVEGMMPIVVVRTAAGVLGLAVEEVLGRQEIVIKTLGSLKPMERSYFGGATIDPEGRVILVLDPSRLGARQSIYSPPRSASAYPISGLNAAEQPVEAGAVILLIDDSLSIRKFVGKMLESAGYSIDTAVDGEDGLRKASESAYRLIITDIEMPKLNGYEVVQALRGRPQTQQTPVIVMTTRAGDKHRQLALDIGANAYIAKPVDERTLLKEVEQWVGPTPAIHV